MIQNMWSLSELLVQEQISGEDILRGRYLKMLPNFLSDTQWLSSISFFIFLLLSMQSLYLSEYIASPLFLEHIKMHKLPCDAILSDIAYGESQIPVFSLDKKSEEMTLVEYRSFVLSSYAHPWIIMDQLSLEVLSPLFKQYPDKHITIINLHAGMGSLGRKISPELGDLQFVPKEYAVYEPLDLLTFQNILESHHQKYLRIGHQHFPEDIFAVEEIGIVDQQIIASIDLLSLTSYGYHGDEGTLLATASLFPTALQIGDILNEEEKSIDIFMVSLLNLEWSDEIITSLKRTKKLFFLIDHLPIESLRSLISVQLEKAKLKDIEVLYFTPNYGKLTTIFDEFSAEQADFDAPSIVEKIME